MQLKPLLVAAAKFGKLVFFPNEITKKNTFRFSLLCFHTLGSSLWL